MGQIQRSAFSLNDDFSDQVQRSAFLDIQVMNFFEGRVQRFLFACLKDDFGG